MTMTMVIKVDDETAHGSELWEFGDGLELPNLYRWNLSPACLDFREDGKPQDIFSLKWETIWVLFSPMMLTPQKGRI